MGSALATHPRAEFVLSTKVGRLVRPLAALRPGDDLDHQAFGDRDDAYYAEVGDRRIVFDYSADGVRRSVEASLERLGLARIDILYIHDPDRHWRAALQDAYPGLSIGCEPREQCEGAIVAPA